MNQEKIGVFIKEMRVRNKLTQQQMADKLGVTYQAVSKWENGKNIPDISTLKLICDTFNVDINDLLDGKKHRNKKHILLIVVIILVLLVLMGVFFYCRQDNFNFTSLGTNCEEFKLNGLAAYNNDKSAIYISSISYCGKENSTIYDKLECNLYEKYNDVITKISSCEQQNDKTLENYLANVSVKIDNYNVMCRKFNNSNMYLEINATKDDQTVTYKIPITLSDEC